MNILEFRGQAQLPDAITAISAGQGPDLAVVRSFITDPGLLEALDDRSGSNQATNGVALYAGAPVLREADELVADIWSQTGYKGMSVTSGLFLDQVRINGIAPHLDLPIYGDRTLEAVAQASLCLSGQRSFSGERLPVNFRRDDGTFDLTAYEEYTYIGSELYTSISAGRTPRSKAEIYAGDLALFGHHPIITLHAVSHDEGQRSVARLLTWRANKID